MPGMIPGAKLRLANTNRAHNYGGNHQAVGKRDNKLQASNNETVIIEAIEAIINHQKRDSS